MLPSKLISFRPVIMTLVLGVVLFFSIAAGQEPLQFNVPYHCPDGTDNIVTRCETNARGGEVCYWREEKNGQLIVERFNIRSQMDGWLKTCKVQKPPQVQAAPKPNGPPATPAANPQGQPMNHAYLSRFPSIDAVKRAIQASNPTDTLARQAAAFSYLSRTVTRMQMVPGRGYLQYTPDETRLITAYNVAANEVVQGFKKSATP